MQFLNGILIVGHSSALGQPGGGTFIGAGVTLRLGHTGTLAENFLSITGSVAVVGTNTVAGQIQLPGTTSFVAGNGNRLTLAGVLTGAGSPLFQSGGSFVLTGTNACAGQTTVLGTTLLVHGRNVAGLLLGNASVLGGTGLVGPLVVNGGAIAPGASPGVLSSGDVSVIGVAPFRFELNGPAVGTEYDQLNVTGTVALNNALLRLTLGFTPPGGTVFTLINNDGADAVSGTFAGLPEGAILTTNGVDFRVSYLGGTGNDVTLTVPGGAPPSTIQFSGLNSNGLFTLTGAGFSNAPYVLEATTHLNAPIPWQPISTNTSDASGVYQFIDSASTNFPIRFYRVQSP